MSKTYCGACRGERGCIDCKAVGKSVVYTGLTGFFAWDGKAEALEFNVHNDFSHLGVPLKEMKLKPNILLAGIIRNRKTLLPSGDDVILAGDRVIVISTDQRLQDLSDIVA